MIISLLVIGTCYRICESNTESANATVLAKGNSSNDNLENNLLDLLEIGGDSGIYSNRWTVRLLKIYLRLGRLNISLLSIMTYLR